MRAWVEPCSWWKQLMTVLVVSYLVSGWLTARDAVDDTPTYKLD